MKRWPMRLLIACLLATVAALSLLFVNQMTFRHSTESLNQSARMFDTQLALQTLLRRMVDAESGQRGYLLTGRDDYLVPFRAANQEIGSLLSSLREHYGDDPPSLADFAALERLVRAKLVELDTILELARKGQGDTWKSMLDADIGLRQMMQIREKGDVLLARERARAIAFGQQIDATLSVGRYVVATLVVACLFGLLLYLRQSEALERERREAQDRLIADRDALEGKVQRRTEQLSRLAQHLQTAREDERRRLARELHDELGALLTAAKLDAARIRSRVQAVSPDLAERLRHLDASLNEGISLKRRIIEDLHPSSLSNLGLVAALEILVGEFGERSGLAVDLSLETVRVSQSAELTVFRLVQEALTNVARHARASGVRVVLAPEGEGARIGVTDDGAGFDPAVATASAHGLLGMRYRVIAEGGRFTVDSTPGRGTTIAAWLPAAAAAPA